MVCLLRVGLSNASDRIDEQLEDSQSGQFGSYFIDRHKDGSAYELGRGAMGVTYRAIDTSLQRAVALKIIKTDLAGRSTEARERFMREARAAAALRHPNVATVYHFGIREETGQCFYAMELVEGETLDARVRRIGPLDVRTTVDIAQQIASALAAAEKRRLVHRDLKPANVMIATAEGPDGIEELSHIQIKVIDFGVAKALTEQTDPRVLTHNGFVGTPAFASPEQFANGSVDVRSDIYSLGATLWYLLTGKIPFAELFEARATPPVEQLTAARVPARLISLLCRMLAAEPASRPSVHDLFASLEEIRARISSRGKRLRLLGIAAVLVAAAVTAFSVFRSVQAPPNEGGEAESKSVAVLPFQDLTHDNSRAYFASGIQDDLLANLSKVADLKVIARDSVLSYKNHPQNVREIGKTLGVDAVLKGNVRYAGTRARIDVQLIDAIKGEQIWAQAYDREMADAFGIESELALQIASALKAKLTPAETARLKRRPTENGEAYLLYIQASDLFANYDKGKSELEKAEQLCEKAIQLDPSFALAYALLSRIETIINSAVTFDPARREKARAAAREALRLQPDLPEAHVSLGYDYYDGAAALGDRELENAWREFEIARSDMPNNASVYNAMARIERSQGKFTQSIGHFEKAASLDPNTPERWHNLFYGYELIRNYPAAEKALDRAIALSPNTWSFEHDRALLQIHWKGFTSALEYLRAPVGNAPDDLHTEDRFNDKMFLRRYAEAEKVLLQDPRETLNQLPKSFLFGELYFQENDLPKARASFEEARPIVERLVQQNPRETRFHSTLAEIYARLGRKEDAIREAKRTVEITPESKDAWHGRRALMDLAHTYVMVGEPDLALPIIENLHQAPAGLSTNELRLDPIWNPLRSDPRFKTLLGRPDVILTTADQATEKSVAVLPFENPSDDKPSEDFANGIHDSVLVNLSKIGDLKVISKNSVFPYKGKEHNVREIGRALGVTAVLEGNVRCVGSRARVNVQLIDTATDEQIWAENFDREVADVFSAQSELALRIAAVLHAKLSPVERTLIERPPTRDLEAYNLYLRAKELMFNLGSAKNQDSDTTKAIESLNQAIARDPTFVLAYCLLSRVHVDLFYADRHATAHLDQARSCVETALRLAPDSGEAHFANAFYLFHGLDDPERALPEFAVAKQELPNSADVFAWSGILERRLGHWAEALRDLQKAADRDPHNALPPIDLIVTYEMLRNYSEAERVIERALIAIPSLTNRFRARKADLALSKGDTQACRTILESLPPDYKQDGFIPYLWARLALYNRDYAEGARVLEEIPQAELTGFTRAWVARDQAFLARAQGNADKARVAFLYALEAWELQLGASSNEADARSYIALWKAALGRKEDAINESQNAVDMYPLSHDATNAPALRTRQGLVYTWCGERDLALKQLAELSQIPGGPSPGDLRLNPGWDDLRNDPRFSEIVAAASKPCKLQ